MVSNIVCVVLAREQRKRLENKEEEGIQTITYQESLVA
jgi:hypothetical protein